ncbi:MAG: hypothetical protein GX455_07940, partial [Phycisphaerae bacterium]|nr:hypothetical protein [Phycisphaerae bacterium]
MKTQTNKILFGILCVISWSGVSEATNNSPIAVVSPMSQTVTVGQTAFFNGSGSFDPDYGQTIVAYAWTFPPEAVMIKGYDLSQTYCKFNSQGEFTVTLMVQDSTGLWSTTAYSCTVTVSGTSNTWYVSPYGNDVTNNGMTSGTAFHRIQTAIDCAGNGDIVEVAPGIYSENINYRGKSITIQSCEPENPESWPYTVIDGHGTGAVVSFSGAETSSAMLRGITVRGGGSDTEQLMAHWSFDSNAEDVTGGHHGSFNGNAAIVTDSGGHIVGGGALSLNGAGDFVSIGGYTGIPGRQARTCMAWIKTTGTVEPIVYWGDKNTTGGMWDMRVSNTGKLRLLASGGPVVDSLTTINTGQWVHVAAVLPEGGVDAGDIQLYINGVLETNMTVTAGAINTGAVATVRIGTNETGHSYTGKIDDVRIYRRALSAGEIRAFVVTSPNPSAAHWKLDEGDGDTISDSSGNNHSGILNSMESGDWATGVFGNCLEFGGTDEYVTVTDYAGVTGGNPRTCTAWIQTSTSSTDVAILSWGDKGPSSAAGSGWSLYLSNGKLDILVRGAYRIGTTDLRDGRWHHVAVTAADGSDAGSTLQVNEITLYVDGVVESLSTDYYPTQTVDTGNSNPVLIGARYKVLDELLTGFFVGRIDDVRIYNSALTAEEIKALSAFSAPDAYWRLDEISGISASDSGPHSLSGSLQNMDGNSDWVSGVSGNSLEFDGTDDYVAVTNYKGISGSKARTTAAWIKTTDTVAPIVYWGNKDVTGGLWDMRVSNTGKLRVVAAGGPVVDSVTTINTGRWVHVAAVLPEGGNNTDDILLYINGVLETGTTMTAGTINTGAVASVRIGANETGNCYTGQIDDVRIYRRALTAVEIRELAGGGSGIRGFGTAATISQCVVENNQGILSGGGIWDVDGTISRCLIRGNSAVGGGGLAVCGTNEPDGSSILNCIVAANTAQSGGGLADCTAKIRNCTIVDNLAPVAGGLLNCSGSIINCILWGNRDDLFNSPSVSYSCVQNLNINEITEYTTAHIHHRNPNLGSDYHLQIPSYCINHGNNDGGIYESGEKDIDGDNRCINGCVDIGADEFSAANLLFVEPGGYSTIQAAINASEDGDVVVVMPGIYTDDGNRDLTFGGRKITVQSIDPTNPDVVAATVINCQGATENRHRGFLFNTNETNDSIVDGLTIINGCAPSGIEGQSDSLGGGILCHNSSPMIRRCGIRNCTADEGGGIGFFGNFGSVNPIVEDCEITENTSRIIPSASGGGGIKCYNSNVLIQNCHIYHNTAEENDGGGIHIEGCSPSVESCLIENNSAVKIDMNGEGVGRGGGIWIGKGDTVIVPDPVIQNCMIQGNIAYDGGGIRVWKGNAQIVNCIIVGNNADHSGGAIHIGGKELEPSSVNVLHCSMIENVAKCIGGGNGGGGITVDTNYASLHVANSILWGNRDAKSPENIQEAQIQGSNI